MLKFGALAAAASPAALYAAKSILEADTEIPLVTSHVPRPATFDRRNQNCCWISL